MKEVASGHDDPGQPVGRGGARRLDAGTPVPAVPDAGALDNWSQEAYSLSVSAASTLGFPVGNITVSYQRDTLMFGSSRWTDVASGEHTYRFGVALRAIVVVSDINGSGALTLPVVAAKSELEGARASAQLLVRGYKGSTLGDLLPAWQTFGVDSYGQYMTAITALQKQIMEDAGNIQPELLATTVISPKAVAPAEAVGTVYALHAIAEGATLAHALDKLPVDDEGIAEAVKALYRATIGEDDRAPPTRSSGRTRRTSCTASTSPGLVPRLTRQTPAAPAPPPCPAPPRAPAKRKRPS